MRPNIFICAAPKSGSSHIKATLLRLLGYRAADAVVGNDNVLNFIAAQLLFSFEGQVFHHHVEATPNNIRVLSGSGVKIILTQRNVLDSVVSLQEYMDTKMGAGDLWDAGPGGAVSSWTNAPLEQKLRWAVYHSAPWYFKHYVMWRSAELPRLVVDYDTFFGDQVAGLRRILDYVGVGADVSDETLRRESLHKCLNYNVGRPGRGREILPGSLIDVMYKQADSWGPVWGGRIRRDLLDER